jgi:hypothetical protein
VAAYERAGVALRIQKSSPEVERRLPRQVSTPRRTRSAWPGMQDRSPSAVSDVSPACRSTTCWLCWVGCGAPHEQQAGRGGGGPEPTLDHRPSDCAGEVDPRQPLLVEANGAVDPRLGTARRELVRQRNAAATSPDGRTIGRILRSPPARHCPIRWDGECQWKATDRGERERERERERGSDGDLVLSGRNSSRRTMLRSRTSSDTIEWGPC